MYSMENGYNFIKKEKKTQKFCIRIQNVKIHPQPKKSNNFILPTETESFRH